jgi:CHAT domain-containing protein
VVSHAEVGPDPDDFFILTHDGRITIDGLDRAIRPTLYRQQPLDLLVLSACSTASGDDRVALGLAGVALKAGARSTIASLWSINDQSTGEFFSTFYKTWISSDNPSKAQSVRAAQLALLHDSRFKHAAAWAPFVLIGNWQ